MPELCVAQRTDEWLQLRLGKITASLAAACLGLDPYISRQKAWRKIMGCDKPDDNPFMAWGRQFEAAARLDFEAITGVFVTETGFWVHPDYPWLGASPDGLIGADEVFECKCPTIPPQRVPVHHRIQCIIETACTVRKACRYFAWGAKMAENAPHHIGDNTFMARVLPSGLPGLIERLHQFYTAYVVTGIEPPRRKRKRAA